MPSAEDALSSYWSNHGVSKEILSKDLKGSCRNLYMRGHMVENVAQTIETDMVNYLKR